MITYVIENTIDSILDFPAWGGAVDVIEQANKVGRIDELNDLVNEWINTLEDGRMPTITEINDLIWFDADDILDLYNEYDEEETSFEFWGGARQVVEQLRKEDLLEDASVLIETAFEGETPDSTQINDYVWFDLEDDLQAIYGKTLWPED